MIRGTEITCPQRRIAKKEKKGEIISSTKHRKPTRMDTPKDKRKQKDLPLRDLSNRQMSMGSPCLTQTRRSLEISCRAAIWRPERIVHCLCV